MDEETRIKYGLLSVGSMLVAVSFTLVGKYAFEGDIHRVFLGYLVFVAGYKSCWYGVHLRGGFERFRSVLIKTIREAIKYAKSNPLNYLLIFVGVYSAAYGTVAFSGAVQDPTVGKIVIAGVAAFGGYIMAHEGVNEVPI